MMNGGTLRVQGTTARAACKAAGINFNSDVKSAREERFTAECTNALATNGHDGEAADDLIKKAIRGSGKPFDSRSVIPKIRLITRKS